MKAAAIAIATIGIWATEIPRASADNFFTAVLSGAYVCNLPPGANPPLCRLGDADGEGIANIVIRGPTNLCASIMVDGISTPSAAHLHVGQASYSGPVLVRLIAPSASGTAAPGTSIMCNNAVPAATIAAIINNPQFYYIDIHAEGYQFGVLRGQLF